MAMMGSGPWGTAQEVFNKFARQDRQLLGSLHRLSVHQANDDKLAWAIESGRVYGLRQQKCNVRLQKQLNREVRHAPTEPMW